MAAVAVLGAGSWGTALAVHLARLGRPVLLWGRDAGALERLARERHHPRYLPGVALPPEVEPVPDLAEAAARAEGRLLVVVPSHALRELLEALGRIWAGRRRLRLALATKGLEPGTGRLLPELAEAVLGPLPLAVVSGPTFAVEVAQGLPAAVTVASRDAGFAAEVAGWLHGGTFRAYTSDDLIGVALGGAVKNVLAIAAGIADGLGFGANTRAALVTRGLAEMMRLGEAWGGRRETFMGLAGLGDLVLTCTDDQSRNRRLGLALGRGEPLEAALAAIGQAVEGVGTARELRRRARELGVEMPISEQVHRVLHEGLPPREAVRALLAREPKAELG